jgi:glutathione S-transferase
MFYSASGEWSDMVKPYPNFAAWHERVAGRPIIKKLLQERLEAMTAQQQQQAQGEKKE